MIVRPPRSEAELSPRLRSISIHALDKNDDPDDRPPLIPRWIVRRIIVLTLILVGAGATQFGLWIFTLHPGGYSRHAEMADLYRRYAREVEATAKDYRNVARIGMPGYIRNTGILGDPLTAGAMAQQAEKMAKMYRDMATNEERLNQGFPAR